MTTLADELDALLMAHETMVRLEVERSFMSSLAMKNRFERRVAEAMARFEERLDAFKKQLPDRPPSFSRQENDFA